MKPLPGYGSMLRLENGGGGAGGWRLHDLDFIVCGGFLLFNVVFRM
jgi:hypothetical protein